MEENKDQVLDDVAKTDQSSEQSQDKPTEKVPTVEEAYRLAKAVQADYTRTRQDLANINDQLQTIASSMNQQSGAQSGDDEFVTVGKLKEVLREAQQGPILAEQKANEIVDAVLSQLEADGFIKNDEDKQSFAKFATELGDTDLKKAAKAWKKVVEARNEGMKEAVKVKEKQEEGSKIGTSSRTTGGESGGVDISKVKNTDWFGF